jgi:indole-3-acetate monooxygenase
MSMVEVARSLFGELDALAVACPPDGTFDRRAMDLIASAGLRGMAVPEVVGGCDPSLSEVVEVWAELSRADGSIGWCAFASDSALAYFGSYLPDEGVGEIFSGGADLPLMAGQFAPNGVGAPAEGGDWVVDGEFNFGSGMLHASWAGAGFFTAPQDGSDPDYLLGCFPADLVEPKGNWDVLGLRATQSIDYGVHGVRIPPSRTFPFFAPVVHRGSAKHHLGVLPLTAAGHAAWALGVSRRMLDELGGVAGRTRMGAPSSLSGSEHFLVEFARLESRQRAGRAWVAEVCDAAEAECEALGGPPTVMTANLLRQACVHVNREAVAIAREAYSLAGTVALREGPLQRCFRDLHAGSQHYFASDAASVDFARSVLGTQDN